MTFQAIQLLQRLVVGYNSKLLALQVRTHFLYNSDHGDAFVSSGDSERLTGPSLGLGDERLTEVRAHNICFNCWKPASCSSDHFGRFRERWKMPAIPRDQSQELPDDTEICR